MTANPVWIYDLATGIFKRGGYALDLPFDAQTEGSVELTENPNIALDRYDMQASAVRQATSQELAAYVVTEFDTRATNAFSGNKILVAAVLAVYSVVLRRLPTQQEQAALFDTAKTIYKSL